MRRSADTSGGGGQSAVPATREGKEQLVASGSQRFSIISDGLPTQLPDIDPDETREWLDSFDDVVTDPRPVPGQVRHAPAAGAGP